MAIPFEPGTKVRMKSGGPDMMVVGEAAGIAGGGSGQVLCEWQHKVRSEWKYERKAFAPTSLEIVSPDEDGSFMMMG
jgi:uncharacterized protein YodC (DUF2158 family)